MLKDTEETTQKIKDVITTPIDMSKIDTTKILENIEDRILNG